MQVKLCSDTGCLHDACGQRAHYPCSVHRSGFSLSEPSLSLSLSSASEAAAAAFKGICHADAGFTQTCLQKACWRRTHKLCSVHLAVRTITDRPKRCRKPSEIKHERVFHADEDFAQASRRSMGKQCQQGNSIFLISAILIIIILSAAAAH